MACCLLHNYIGQEMLIGPFKNKSGCDEGTRDHEVAQEDDNITHVGTSNEWTSFRDNLAQSMSKSISELSNVGEAYEKSGGLHSVVKLILVESGGEDNYFAFEDFDDNLATFIKKLPFLDFNIRIVILRQLVEAVLELNANFAFHNNLGPESILVKLYVPTCRYVVKLCGMTASSWHSSTDLSDQIVLGEYDDIDKESEIAFGSSWHIENEVFKAWFKEMEDAHKKDKREDDEAKSPYDVRSLEHLLRFITNTLGHPTKRLRGSSKAEDSIKNMVIRSTPLYKEYMVQTRSNFEGQIHYEYAS
ncbi:ALP1-like protein [Tanacetum coccineum]